jgi:hypothetical protein
MAKCQICGTRSPALRMAHKTKWTGGYRWFHPECVAAQQVAQAAPNAVTEQERKKCTGK